VRLIVSLLLPLVLLAQPKRIVSTAPSITETLFELGLGGRVVGVSQYCHYPPEVRSRTIVGTFLQPNAEVIARLRPELVIIQKLPNNSGERLRSLSLNVAEVDTGDLARNLESMQAIAAAAGVPDKGAALAARVRRDLDAIRAASRGNSRPRVLFVVGRTPGRLEGIIAVGSASYLNELIGIAGGTNVLAAGTPAYARISLETVVRENPDVIIDMGEMAETTGVTEERKRAVAALWQTHPLLAAVKSNRVFAVASDIYVVPGPRMVDAARAISGMLHVAPAVRP
jgi:iron complex transport system substrate-binding protein